MRKTLRNPDVFRSRLMILIAAAFLFDTEKVLGQMTSTVPAATGRAISDRIRECWAGDTAALDFDKLSARLLITIDSGGTIRDAQITQLPGGTVGRAFAERARRAALSSQCATLPLPSTMLGSTQTFEITFKP